jgi:hypothetical protein
VVSNFFTFFLGGGRGIFCDVAEVVSIHP